jgi:ABC-type proline/glycine betaine transport system permease subunit
LEIMNSIKFLLSSLLQFLKLYWKEFILFGGVFTFILVFVFWFVGQEKTIYMYDYANYHKMFVEFGEKFAFSRRATLSWLIESIRNYEYNHLHTVFLFPFYYFFGDSRISFISSVSVIYAFPPIILFSLLVKTLVSLNLVENQSETENYSKINKSNYSLILIPTIFLALFPAYWNPTITGFPDVGGVGVIFFILILYFRKPLLKQNIF